MADWHRIAAIFCTRPVLVFLALLVAVGAASFAQVASGHSAPHPLSAQTDMAQPRTRYPLPLIEPDWLAIADDSTGTEISLAAKWRESPDSPDHEREILLTTGWMFSRLFDCEATDCGNYVRAILSGGVLQGMSDIQSFADLADQMPKREITRLVASIAGRAFIDADRLQPIERAGFFGYRVRTNRQLDDGESMALVVDCLYRGNRFLVLTAATAKEAHDTGALALDTIAAGIISKSQSGSNTATTTEPAQ